MGEGTSSGHGAFCLCTASSWCFLAIERHDEEAGVA